MSGLRRIAEFPEAIRGLLGGRPLKGLVLYPGEETLTALERLTELFPAEVTLVVESAEEGQLPGLGKAFPSEVFIAQDQESTLRESLLGGPGQTRTSPVRPRVNTSGESDDTSDRSQRRSTPSRSTISPLSRDYDFLLRGSRLTLETVYRACRNTVEKVHGRSGGEFLSQVALFEPAEHRLFLVSDCLLNARPDAEARLQIIRNAVSAWDTIGAGPARVALLAAIEQVSPGVPVTVESAETAEASKKEVPGVSVEGPLSFDVALDEEAAREKGAKGEVAGRANVLIGSTVEVSHGIYAALTLLPRVVSASAVVGGRVPMALPFPSDGVRTTVDSACFASLLSLRRVA